jgi:hypothetical protein
VQYSASDFSRRAHRRLVGMYACMDGIDACSELFCPDPAGIRPLSRDDDFLLHSDAAMITIYGSVHYVRYSKVPMHG